MKGLWLGDVGVHHHGCGLGLTFDLAVMTKSVYILSFGFYLRIHKV